MRPHREQNVERLDYAERWFRDNLDVLQPGISVSQITVDMTEALRRIDALRRAGAAVTSTHLLVSAAARALADNPKLHQLVAGSLRYRPAEVDIGLAVSGDTFVAPVLVIDGADKKSVVEIAAEAARRVPDVQEEHRALVRALRRWGRLVPFSSVRRRLLRFGFESPTLRRKIAGTFQISTVPVDWALTSVLVSSGVLVAGRVASRVVAVEGRPVVRPMMTLTVCADHGVWDGRDAARFLAAVRATLEAAHEDTERHDP